MCCCRPMAFSSIYAFCESYLFMDRSDWFYINIYVRYEAQWSDEIVCHAIHGASRILVECRNENVSKEILIKKKKNASAHASVNWNLKLGIFWARQVFFLLFIKHKVYERWFICKGHGRVLLKLFKVQRPTLQLQEII